MSVFKACDIRGVPGKDLSPELFRRIGRALAHRADGGRVTVGGDVRLSTPALKTALIEGLCAGGCSVADLGVVPTPLVYFAHRHLKSAACAIVTASHNPPEYNGLKFMLGELPVLPEDVKHLEAEVAVEPEPASPRGQGEATAVDLGREYADFVLQTARDLESVSDGATRPFSMVVDAGNGAFSHIAPEVAGRLDNTRVIPLFCEPDGRFPNRDPNCAVAAHLSALRNAVRESKADLGMAFDGDGDRVRLVDEQGGVLSPDETIVILLRSLAHRLAGRAMVYDLKCSQIVAREAKDLGAHPIMERSGHAFIKRRMIADRALVGGEVSGHYFYEALHGGDDGLFTGIHLARFVQRSGLPLSMHRAKVAHSFITQDLRIPCAPARVREILERIRASAPPEARTEIDGVRVEYPTGWALARGSITEPKLTLRFEGDSPEGLREVLRRFLDVTPELREEVLSRTNRAVHGEPA